MYITNSVVNLMFFVCSGKVMSSARSDKLVTFTGSRHEALPIDDRDLLAAALNQPRMFQLRGSIRDRWSLDPEHFGEQVLIDQERVMIAAVAHHQQPTR